MSFEFIKKLPTPAEIRKELPLPAELVKIKEETPRSEMSSPVRVINFW
jgi:hypothetical protein